ncbi:hypothetical protein C8R27_110105, partial [Nitrosomonas ureae]
SRDGVGSPQDTPKTPHLSSPLYRSDASLSGQYLMTTLSKPMDSIFDNISHFDTVGVVSIHFIKNFPQFGTKTNKRPFLMVKLSYSYLCFHLIITLISQSTIKHIFYMLSIFFPIPPSAAMCASRFCFGWRSRFFISVWIMANFKINP